MFNLVDILVAVSVLTIIISIWGIYYFVGKFITWLFDRKNLGDMPSAEEIHKLYERLNKQNGGDQHPR